MLSCPNESSNEWKTVLAIANGNRDRALEMWREEQEFLNKKNLNKPIDKENFEDERQGEIDPVDAEKDNDFSKFVEKIKLYLNKQLAILKQKKVVNQEKQEADIQLLINNIEAAEGAESIAMFIKDAYQKAIIAKRRFDNLVKDKNTKDRKELMQQMTALNDFISGYSILDEISKKDILKYFSGQVDQSKDEDQMTPQEMLTEALNIKRDIKNKYVTIGIPLMGDFLLQYKSEDVQEKIIEQVIVFKERIRKIEEDPKLSDKFKAKRIAEIQSQIDQWRGFNLDKSKLVDILEMASKDEGVLDYLISPLISSEDSALALFAKAIKSQLETARLLDIDAKENVAGKFEEYAKATSELRDNPAKFNDGIYEIREYTFKDKNGKDKTVRRAAFVQKYDMDAFYKAREAFYATLGPKPPKPEITSSKAEKQEYYDYIRKVSEWYKKNSEPKPKAEIDDIIAKKVKEREKRLITEEEYKEWEESVMYKNKSTGEITYKKELTQPSSKYISTKWSAMYDQNDKPKNKKGEYHSFLLNMYLNAQEKLPDSQKPGYYLPSIPKTENERIINKGVLNYATTKVKESVKIQAYDTQYGLAGLSEQDVKFLPVLYTNAMSADDVSLDLARSVLLFNSMANRYEALNEINAEISLFKTIIGEREIAKTNSKGQPIMDAFAKKLGYTEYIRQNGEPNSTKHVNAFIDMIVYGESQKREDELGLAVSKITNTLIGFSAITSIAADLLKGIANNMQGNIQLIIEANSGEFFSKSNLGFGKKEYAKGIKGFLSDFGKATPESFLGKMTELYDPMQGNFKDKYGNNVSPSMVGKLLRTDTLFFNQYFGEHEIQVSCMLALMDATKVIDNATGEAISLFEAHKKYKTLDELYKNTNYTEKRRQAFQNRLHALSKRMHGVYNEFDKGTMQRYSLGRLVTLYRKHLIPAYKKRWKKLSMDEELGSPTEGYYMTFWRLYFRDLLKLKFSMMQKWSSLSPFEKAQMKRVIAEATIIISTTALVWILKSIVDDDDDELKDNYAYNFLLYELIRMRSETSSYIMPNDAYRTVKSPSALTTHLERIIKFVDQFFLTWDPEKLTYQRKTGVWNEGDNKSWAYFLKLMGYSGYNLTPEEAVKSFEGTLNK
jgi:hypothetical protein